MLFFSKPKRNWIDRGQYDPMITYKRRDRVWLEVSGVDYAYGYLGANPVTGVAPTTPDSGWVRLGGLTETPMQGPQGTSAPLLMTQYSADGNPPWRDTYMAGDIFKRTSNDNGTTWSTAQRFRGDDGIGTPAPQTMIQYSTNGSPPWRDTYMAGDIFKRESTDGGMTWSGAIRFRGEDGTDGIDGVGTDGTDGIDAVGTDGREIIYETSADGLTYISPPAVASKVQFVRTRYQGQPVADAVVWNVGGDNGTTLTPQYSPDNSAGSWGAYDAPTSRYMRPQLADGSYPSAGVLIRADDFSIVTQYSEDNNTFYDNTNPIATTVAYQRFGAKNERTGNINWFPSFPIAYSFDVSTAADVTVDNTNLGNNLPTTTTNVQEAIDAIDDAIFSGGLSAVATDSTLTGDGSTTDRLGIADDGVSTQQIIDGAVTNAKLANSAVNTAQLANDAVTTDKIADHAINQSKIADGSVDTDELVDDAVTNAKIADNAVDTAQIEDDAVTLAKMASGTANMYIGYDASGNPAVLGAPGGGGLMTVASDATLTGTGTTADPIGVTPDGIDTAHLADNAVETPQIANGVVTTDKLANLAVTGAKIADATITNTKLANDAVDLAHMAHGTANHFIGYDASGAPAGIQLTTNSTLEGFGTPTNNLGIADGGVNTAQIADSAVTTAKVADNAITTAKMADNSVDTAHLANDAVTTAKIANNAITSAQIAGNAVTSSEIADDAVDTAEIVDMAVTQDKLANTSVGTAQLINDAVTQDKVADNAIGTAQIASSAVTSAEIATNAVTTGEIVNDAVTQDKIADDAVGTDQVADNAITNAQLANNAVNTAEIANDAVTQDKIADNAVGLDQLAGGTAGAYLGFNASGDPAELTAPPGGLSTVAVDGTTIDGDGTSTNPLEVADTGVSTAKLADDAVTGAKIADDAVDTAHLADDAVNTPQIADNAVTSAQIAVNSITTAEIQNDAVTGDKVADNAIANAHLADNAVNTAEVADDAITLGKMAHGTANMYLGYNASGEPAVLGSPGGGGLTSVVSDGTLSGDGTVGNALGVADDGIDTAQIADNAVETAQINNGAVTASKIADNTITATQIASDTITAAELAANAVNTAEIANDAVTNAKLADDAVGTAQIADNAVTNAQLANNAVNTAEIADNAITQAKLADNVVGLAELAHGTADRFLGFNSSGEPAELPAPAAGISSVTSDATLTGDGTSGTPLGIADNGVSTAKIANDAVTNAKIADNAINTAQITNDAVTGAKIADNAVDTAQIANNAVETSQIAGDAVTTAKIADNSVGLAQLSHGTADRYLGFNSSGEPAELTAPSGGGLSAVTSDGTLTGDGTSGNALGIANAGVNTTQLADDAVTNAKVANNAIGADQIAGDAVGNSEIADNAVHTAQINDDAITNAKVADDAVDTAQIANNAVTNPKLANNSVESAQIAQNAVGTSEIADNAVTLAKLAGGTANRYIGFDASGDPAELTAPVGAGNTIMHIDAVDTSVSGNTIVLSPTPAITSISPGDTFHFQIPPNFSNTSAVLVRISNLTAYQLHNSKGENFFAGRIPAGRWVRAIFETHLNDTFITNVDELPLEYVHEGNVTQTASTPNEITLTVPDALATLHHGDIYEFITKETNTGDVTLQINSIAAVSLLKPDGNEIGAGELPANRLVRITCDVSVGVYTFIADLNPVNIPEATTTQAGLLSASDKGKLDNLSVSGQAFHHVVPANVAATADLITLTVPGITAYTEGLRLGFQMPGLSQQNAGIDLQINSLGGRPIVKNTDLLNFGANELEVDSYIEVVYVSASNKFISNVPADYHTIFVGANGVSHSGNDITLNPTFTPGSSSSVAYKFVTEASNTGDVTLLVNGIGINRAPMVKQDGSQYASGELPTGLMLAVIYDSDNSQYWTANYNGPTGAGGLNQTEVDSRITTLVDTWAQVASAGRIPDDKLPVEITENEARAGTVSTIRSWTALRVRQAANAAINALVSAWALVGNSDKVPDAKLPDTVTQADAEAGTGTDIVSWTAERVKQSVKALGSQLTVANLINTIYDKVHVTPITEIHGIDENYVYWSDTVARTGESGVNVVRVFYLQDDVSTELTATEQQETFATGEFGKVELSTISGRIAAIRSANSDYAGEIVIAVRRRIGQVKGNVNNLAVHDFIHDATSTGHWILARADAGSNDAYWERRLPSGEPVAVANGSDAVFNNAGDSLPDGSSHFLFGITTQSLTSDYFADLRDQNDFPSWRATGTDSLRLNADPNAVDYTATTDLTEISLMGWANTGSNILTTFFGNHHRRAPQSNTSSISGHEIVIRNGIVGDMFYADDPASDTAIFETYIGTRTQFLLQGIMMLGLTFIFDEPQPESWARQGNADRLPDDKLHTAVTESEAETGTETGLRSWSPLRVWDALRTWFTQAEKDGLDKLIHQEVMSANAYNQVETIRNSDIWGDARQHITIVDHKYFNDTHYIIGLSGEFNDQTLGGFTGGATARGFAVHSQTIYAFDRQNNLRFFDLNDYMEFGTAVDLGSDDAIAMTIDESDETEMFILFHANTTTVDIQNFTISTTVEDSTFTDNSNRLNISLAEVNALLTANGFDAHQGNIFDTTTAGGVVSLSRLDNYLYILLSNVLKSGAGYNLRDCMIRVELGGTSGAGRTMTLDTSYFQELNYYPSSHTIDVYGGDDTDPEGVWLAEEFLIVGLERNVQHSTDLGDMPDAHDTAEVNYALVETGTAYRRAKVFGEVVEYFGTGQTSRREDSHSITQHRSTQSDAILIWNATPAYHRNNGNTLLTLLSTPFPDFVQDHMDGYSGFTVPNNAIFRLPQGRYNIYMELTTRTVADSTIESFELIQVHDSTDHVIDGQYLTTRNYRDHLSNYRKFTIDLTEFVVDGTEYFYAAFNSTLTTTNNVAYYAVIAKLD